MMRASRSLLLFALCVWHGSQSATAGKWEGDFAPAPTGEMVGSFFQKTASLGLGPETVPVSSSRALRLRKLDGGVLFEVLLDKGKSPFDLGLRDMRWCPAGSVLAVQSGQKLWAIDPETGKRTELLSEKIASFRWEDETHMVVYSYFMDLKRVPLGDAGEDYDRTSARVDRISPPTGKRQLIFDAVGALEEHPATNDSRNALSADGGFFVFSTGRELRFVDLEKKVVTSTFPVSGQAEFYWWAPDGTACLIQLLRRKKTGRPFPENTISVNVVYLYDAQQGTIEDITAKLCALSGDNNRPATPHNTNPWFPKGQRFLVSGTIGGGIGTQRDWIFSVGTGQVVCLQELLGDDFCDARVSPAGKHLALVRAQVKNPLLHGCPGDLYVATIRNHGEGGLSLTEPTKTATRTEEVWLWHPDGTKLIVFSKGKFKIHSVADAQ